MTGSEIEKLLYGFVAGLLVAFGVLVSGWWKRRSLERDIEKLRSHLHTQMEISHEGADKLKKDLEALRSQNENLRVTVQTWQQKPGRAEQKNLQIYDRAVRSILATTPGFAMAWEAALERAERDVAAADQGLVAFAKRLILPSRSGAVEIQIPRGTRGSSSSDGHDKDGDAS